MVMEKEIKKETGSESLRLEQLEKRLDRLEKKSNTASFRLRVFESQLHSLVWGLVILLFMTLVAIFCVAKYERKVDALQEEVSMLQEEVRMLQTTENIQSN